MAGLDPAIHVDPRVKPGDDTLYELSDRSENRQDGGCLSPGGP
jgi:hypothetical protein